MHESALKSAPATARPQRDSLAEPTRLVAYLEEYREFKARLFALYESENARLEPKDSVYGMSVAWGYWLAGWDGRTPTASRTAASIGTDEIRIFYDICGLIRPDVSYVIGHSFGLSTFCLALAWPAGRVIAIDNWMEPDTRTLGKPLTERIIARNGLTNVHVHTGSSPDDTPAALAGAGDRVSLFFIDGWHRNSAALADFRGALPFLDDRSVVMWHNVNEVVDAFEEAFRQPGSGIFDEHHVLRTHGPLGIFYSRSRHPELHAYLADSSLIWKRFGHYRTLFDNQDVMLRLLALQRSPVGRLAASATRPLRRLLRSARSRS